VIKQEIEKAIASALAEMGAADVPFVVERPASMEHGDYATNAALAAAKVLKKNPKDVAALLAAKLQQVLLPAIKRVEVAGAGFINFTISGMTIKDIVHDAHGAEWGKNDLYKNKKIMVEYTDPNPFKEFHIGHLMSNTIGEAIARILESAGAKVVRANYQGDVGLHVAKALWGKQQKPEASWGEAYAYGSSEYEQNKEAIDLINKKVYEDDASIAGLYEEGRNYSLGEFEKMYAILGTTFDKYFFESESWQVGLALVKKYIGPVFEESEGAVVYKGEQDGLHTRVFLTKAGLTTYEAKDLGLLKLKEAAGEFDISITVTASEQKEYLKVVLAAAKKIDEVKDIAHKTTHVTHGMMRISSGKMSSRLGNVITGESLIAALAKDARGRQDVAVGAIKYAVLRSGNGKDIVFDPEKSLSLEGDSGPYLQYALVRARSLLRKAASAEVVDPELAGPVALERLLVHFPEVVLHASHELEPHYVVTYLTEVAASFNSWYAGERFINDGKVSKRTLAVIQAVENTLAKGLQVLGIPAPEEM